MLKKEQNNFVWVEQEYKSKMLALLAELDIAMDSTCLWEDFEQIGPTGVFTMANGMWFTSQDWREYSKYSDSSSYKSSYPEIKMEDLLGSLYNDSLINQEEVDAFEKELQIKYKL
jgi:hypothetical protein